MVIKKGEDKMEEDKTNEIEEEKDPIIIYFKKWYEENLDRFQCGMFTEEGIALSSFLEGIKHQIFLTEKFISDTIRKEGE